jgi:hypothetical protein
MSRGPSIQIMDGRQFGACRNEDADVSHLLEECVAGSAERIAGWRAERSFDDGTNGFAALIRGGSNRGVKRMEVFDYSIVHGD